MHPNLSTLENTQKSMWHIYLYQIHQDKQLNVHSKLKLLPGFIHLIMNSEVKYVRLEVCARHWVNLPYYLCTKLEERERLSLHIKDISYQIPLKVNLDCLSWRQIWYAGWQRHEAISCLKHQFSIVSLGIHIAYLHAIDIAQVHLQMYMHNYMHFCHVVTQLLLYGLYTYMTEFNPQSCF